MSVSSNALTRTGRFVSIFNDRVLALMIALLIIVFFIKSSQAVESLHFNGHTPFSHYRDTRLYERLCSHTLGFRLDGIGYGARSGFVFYDCRRGVIYSSCSGRLCSGKTLGVFCVSNIGDSRFDDGGISLSVLKTALRQAMDFTNT